MLKNEGGRPKSVRNDLVFGINLETRVYVQKQFLSHFMLQNIVWILFINF